MAVGAPEVRGEITGGPNGKGFSVHGAIKNKRCLRTIAP